MIPYDKIEPIETRIPADRQSAKRHYGVHPYFTRRPYNVVRDYILHYSRERDFVLDPFGGSGVTAIEAFLENRIGIQNDLNPLANFIAQGVVRLHAGQASSYRSALAELRHRCEARLNEIETADEDQATKWVNAASLPPNVRLPRNSDVERYHDLFLPKQLLSLSVLKQAVDVLQDPDAKRGMLLAWSATLAKLNRTFLSAEGRQESRGGSSIFSIYRYKVAKRPVCLGAWKTFQERALNVIEAKTEIDKTIMAKAMSKAWTGEFQVHQKDIEELLPELEGRVDYIFTDPPYGGHIAYLDLSTLWNGWLGSMPTERAKQRELIVGGDLKHDEASYVRRLGNSVRACVKFLKPGRWMSIVFQHWNTAFFETILNTAAECGMDLRAAVSQVGDPIWSMHKKKSSESVIAGELILTFLKVGSTAKSIGKNAFDVGRSVADVLNSVESNHIFGEFLFNRLVIQAWRSGDVGRMNISRSEFSNLIRAQGWHYDESSHSWMRDRATGLLPLH